MKICLFYSIFIFYSLFLGIFSSSVLASTCENDAFSEKPIPVNKWIAMKEKLIEAKADPNETHIPDIANQIPGHLEHISKLIESLPNKSERQRAKRTLTTLEQEASKKVSEGNVTYRWWIEFNFALLQLLNPPNVPIYTLGNKNKIMESFPDTILLPVTYTREEIGGITAINKLHDNRIFPFRLPSNTHLHEANELAGMSRELRNLAFSSRRTTHIDFFDLRFPKDLTTPVPSDSTLPSAFRPHEIAHDTAIRPPSSAEIAARAQTIKTITQKIESLEEQRRYKVEFILFILTHEIQVMYDFHTNADIPKLIRENSDTIAAIYAQQFRKTSADDPAAKKEAEEAMNDFIEITSQVQSDSSSLSTFKHHPISHDDPKREQYSNTGYTITDMVRLVEGLTPKQKQQVETILFIITHEKLLNLKDGENIPQFLRRNSSTITEAYAQLRNTSIDDPAIKKETEEAINDFIEIISDQQLLSQIKLLPAQDQ